MLFKGLIKGNKVEQYTNVIFMIKLVFYKI